MVEITLKMVTEMKRKKFEKTYEISCQVEMISVIPRPLAWIVVSLTETGNI